MKYLVLVAVLLSCGSTFAAGANGSVKVRFQCEQFKNSQNNLPIIGVSAAKIVSLPDSDDILYVERTVISPTARPTFEKLVKMAQQADAAFYESENYLFTIAEFRGQGIGQLTSKGSRYAPVRCLPVQN